MNVIDSHMHSSFSPDSQAEPVTMIRQALRDHFSHICFTDHMEYSHAEEQFELDIPAYIAALRRLKERYEKKIELHIGVELGLEPWLADSFHKLLQQYPFDFVIGSVHVADGLDPCYPEFFQGRTEKEAYEAYFQAVYDNIQAFCEFDILGHLDYVVRYGPNRNRFYTYEKHKEIIDEILRCLIEKGIGLELNTSGFRYGLGHPSPHEDILERYHDLGGEIITIGSDAHSPEYFAYEFTKAQNILKKCGFTYYTYFKERKPRFEKL